MRSFEKFEDFDEESAFVEIVTSHFENAWDEVTSVVGLKPVVDQERVRLAFKRYQLHLDDFRKLLDSGNPDHFKRAAALLHALYEYDVIVELLYEGQSVEELEQNDMLGLSYADCQYRIKFIKYYEVYRNQAMSFDLAMRCCQAYTAEVKGYTPNFLENVCHYLKENTNLNVASMYIILMSFHA